MSSHKPGSLKQSNKKHKGSNGKRAQNRAFGEGKVASTAGTKSAPTSRSNGNERINRINKNNQIKKQKNAANWLQKRLGSAQNSPKLVSIIALSDVVNPNAALESCLQQSTWSCNHESVLASTIVNAYYSTYKTKVTFLKSQSRDIFSSVEAAKLADIIMFVVHAEDNSAFEVIDAAGQETLTAIKALGCPEVIVCATGLDGSTSKANLSLKKSLQQYLDSALVIPDAKLVECASVTQVQRALCNTTPKDVSWRAARSYVVADQVIIEEQQQAGSGKFRVQLSGHLRGVPMNRHSLIHIMDVGTARLVSAWGSSVEERQTQQRALAKAVAGQVKAPTAGGSIVVPASALHSDPERQDSLVMEASGDVLMGEQTWPTEEELAGSDPDSNLDVAAGRNRRAVGSKPKGMSEYQADWFQDEDGRADYSGRVLDDDEQAMLGEEEPEEADEEGADDDLQEEGEGEADEAAAKAEAMRRRAAAAQGDKEFPDEVDTPGDVSARSRFARYRALQSFRASPWHPKENLPQDYAKIFQFENFGGTQRRVLADCKTVESMHTGNVLEGRESEKKRQKDKKAKAASGEEGAMECSDGEEEEEEEGGEMDAEAPTAASSGADNDFTVPGADDFIRPGQVVHLLLEDVSSEVVARFASRGYLAAFNLFQHENKVSVLHFNITRLARGDDETDVIKSKDALLFQAGFRAYTTKPLFSESNLNCDKHKMERFLLSDRFVMASCYGPISYSPCPVLIFKQHPVTQRHYLVATGALNKVDPDRIMLKRIILTGLPIRVRKKFGVVKHMFFDSADVRWFKPAELATKHGLRGHIKEPIGTHGLLKAYFSAPIKQNDTVMLVLYKRVYPKFPAEGLIVK